MFKKVMRNYGFYIVTAALTIIIFAAGYAVGKYGIKSAASLEQAENYKQQQNTVEPLKVTTTAAAPTTEEETASEEAPAVIDLGQFKLTAYCTCVKCCGKSDGVTATGTQATAGRTIAVDPKVIPYGTEIIINGHTYTAEDTGGAIKGNKIDVCVASHEEALNFGVQYANVYKAP